MKNNFFLLILLVYPTISFTYEPVQPIKNPSLLNKAVSQLRDLQTAISTTTYTPTQAQDTLCYAVIRECIETNHVQLLEELLHSYPIYASKINDAVNARGYTCLVYALIYGTPEMVTLLVKNGANPDKKDKCGRLPFTYALETDPYYTEKIAALCKN